MTKTIRTNAAALALTIGTALSAGAANTDNLPRPEKLHTAPAAQVRDVEALLKPARTYYAFWNTGDPAYARQALSPDFVDLNLPEGRPQGPEGPIMASGNFRKAVPNLTVTIPNAYILDGYVISELQFQGNFTGTFGDIKGDGRPISFKAVDIYHIEDGHIATNWHLEDNLTLMKSLGVLGGN